MAFLSSFYPQPVVKGTTAGTYAEGNDSRIVGALPAATAGTGSVLSSGSTTARTLSARFAERVNILDFGADPTGVTSSRTALINAIAAAPSGGVVYIPRGTYSGIHGINITKSISIIGDGDDSTVLDTANSGNSIFSLRTGCETLFCQGLKIQWEGGYTATVGGGSRCITNELSGASPTNLKVIVDSCTFRNFSESVSLWREKAEYMEVTNCKFAYKHGYAGCRFASTGPTNNIYTSPIAGWTVIGNAKETIVKNNQWNGLEDPTFTGAVSGLPSWVYTPIDNFYKGSGRAYDTLVIENNIVKNFAIEGIIVDRYPNSVGSWSDNNDGSYGSKAIIHNNTFIGPQKVGVQSRGVTPAISVWGGNSVSIRNNYIDGAYTGISLKQNAYETSVNASTNKVTVNFMGDNASFLFNQFNNGAAVRFTYLPASHGSGITLNSIYYVINSESPVGNTKTFKISTSIGGAEFDILANINGNAKIMTEKEWQNRKITISGNTIVNCVSGVSIAFGLTSEHVDISNNFISCASEPSKTAAGYFTENTSLSPPPMYTDLVPLSLSGSAVIQNNYLEIKEPAWDGIFDLVSRSGGSNNVMTLAAGQAAQMFAALEQATFGDPPTLQTVYGLITVYNANGNKVHRWPVELIDVENNTVTIFAGWATNGGADTYTSGKLYWTKTIGGTNAIWLSALQYFSNPDQTIYFYNNTINNCALDFRPNGTSYASVVSDGTKAKNLRGGLFSDAGIVRSVEFGSVKMLQGSGDPQTSAISAPNGSLYLRTDGDASTTLYVRSSGAWKPLSSWNP